jgi:D-glycero-D-manno-heptose 1,7-bisphosphate phosphatase
MTQRAIFLDRDGVVCENRSDYVKSWDEFVFLPHVFEALRRIAASEFVVLVTTNQSVVSRGLATDTTVRGIHARMTDAIARAGGRIDAVYFCPHTDADHCDCRKPRTGMYEQGKREWNIDFARSYVVGDAETDIAAARAIGAQSILVLTGRGKDQHVRVIENHHSDYHVADDLLDAVEWILGRENKS